MRFGFRTRSGGVLLLLFLAGLCACGLMQSGPGDTVKRFYSAIDKGNINEAIQLLDPGLPNKLGDGLVRAALARQSENMRSQHGGIASVQVEKEEIRGDLATVQVRISYKDGTAERQTEKLVRVSGRWRITASK